MRWRRVALAALAHRLAHMTPRARLVDGEKAAHLGRDREMVEAALRAMLPFLRLMLAANHLV